MCHTILPENYTFYDKIDLQHNKKHFWIVQGISLVLLVAMIVAGYFIDNISFVENITDTFIALAVLIVGYIL